MSNGNKTPPSWFSIQRPKSQEQRRCFVPKRAPTLQTITTLPPNQTAVRKRAPISYIRMFQEEQQRNKEQMRISDQNPPELEERNIHIDDSSSSAASSSFCFSRTPKYEPLRSLPPNKRFAVSSSSTPASGNKKTSPPCYSLNNSLKTFTEKATGVRKVETWSKAGDGRDGRPRRKAEARRNKPENLADFDIDAMLNEDLPEYRKRLQLCKHGHW